MRTETREIDEFEARDDNGNTYTVTEYQEFIESRTINRPVEWIPGLKSLELDDGSKVNFIDDNTFKIVATDTIIHRIG